MWRAPHAFAAIVAHSEGAEGAPASCSTMGFMIRSVLVSLAWGALVTGCSYGDATSFDDDGEGGFGLPGSSGNVSSGGSNQPEPVTCGDGKKNGAETDLDCGGRCDTKCAVGAACATPADCIDGNLCTAGACAAPSATDRIKNGDESDVDCGGTTTSAPRCAVGQACVVGADCTSRGCAYDGTCALAPSCAVHLGGDTCGPGEVGSGAENHESCCKSLEVPGFTDENHVGQTVYLDKYEVTAGRVREFIAQVTAEQGGVPNVQAWIDAHPPTVWSAGWSFPLTTAVTGDFGLQSVFGAPGDGSADYSSGFYVHGQNCAIAAGRPGYPTYWQPDDIMVGVLGGLGRDFAQDILDVKAMSCISNAMLAAFCAWDGGQIATTDVLQEVVSGAGLPSGGAINKSQDAGFSGGSEETYGFPYYGTNENGGRVAAPGRIPQDAVPAAGGEAWMDLGGNLNEMALQRVQDEGFALIFQGLGFSSAHALQNDDMIPHPAYKAGYSGGRCMRFK